MAGVIQETTVFPDAFRFDLLSYRLESMPSVGNQRTPAKGGITQLAGT